MKAGVLFSGGKDSALAAILLSPFVRVELVTMFFQTIPQDLGTIAHELGFPHITMSLDAQLAATLIDTMMNDGHPTNGINLVHKAALERAAERYRAVADGTRRDDKAPLLTVQEARSLEDRFAIDYVRPLLGYGRSAIDGLVAENLEVKYGECISFDYEVELRQLMKDSYGQEAVKRIFPERHIQSKITRRKNASFSRQA
jgi:predicted subunit of tRNA(5-methylaminomethyl-2-thiouridylate) methyltransferase